MIQQQVYILNNMLMLLDALCVVVAGYTAFYAEYFRSGRFWSMEDSVFASMLLMVMFVNNYVMGRFGLYSEQRPESYLKLLSAVASSVVISFLCLVAALYFFGREYVARDFILFFGGATLLFLAFTRVVIRSYMDVVANRGFNTRKILVVGDMARGQLVSNLLSRQLSWGHTVIGRLAVGDEDLDALTLGRVEDLSTVLQNQAVDEVIFAVAGKCEVDLGACITVCKEMGVPTRILPALWKQGGLPISAECWQGVPFLTIATTNFSATGLFYKRLLDIAGGLVGTTIFLLLYLVVGPAIKLNAPGPVLFRQKRAGRHGRIFEVLKFRTMYVDAEARKKELMARNQMQGAIFKLADDPRITRVGRWLRKTSLDEFPQFWNVLKGEMSLVGTRPPTLAEVARYEHWHRRRIAIKPGITGLWQGSGRNRITDFDQIVALDCQYLEQWRFIDDIKILLKTVLVVLRRKGAA